MANEIDLWNDLEEAEEMEDWEEYNKIKSQMLKQYPDLAIDK